MGKGYNNFMSKKAFHPGSCSSQQKIREAEEKAEAKLKHDQDMAAQYQREQELYQQKLLTKRGDKDKMTLNFMYDPPPGFEEEDKQLKLEWKGKDCVKKETVKKEQANNKESIRDMLRQKRNSKTKASDEDSNKRQRRD